MVSVGDEHHEFIFTKPGKMGLTFDEDTWPNPVIKSISASAAAVGILEEDVVVALDSDIVRQTLSYSEFIRMLGSVGRPCSITIARKISGFQKCAKQIHQCSADEILDALVDIR
jgi:hypothetical protein